MTRILPHARQWLAALLLVTISGLSVAAEKLPVKTVPAYQFFFGEYAMPYTELQQKSEGIAQDMALTIAKQTHTEYYGAFTYVQDHIDQASLAKVSVKMGWPVKAAAGAVKSYQDTQLPAFKCVYKHFEGPENTMMSAWLDFYEQARQQGYKATGQGRTLIKIHSHGYVVAELQLGVH